MDKIELPAYALPDIEMYGGDTVPWEITLIRDDGTKYLFDTAEECTCTLTFTPFKVTTGLGGRAKPVTPSMMMTGTVKAALDGTASLIGTAVILLVEFVSGCILNLWLELGIWDYSDKFLNICGQICPQFAFGWFLLAGVAIVLDDYLRYWLFGEEKPHYQIIGVKKKRRRKKTEFSKILVSWALIITTLCVALSYVLSFTDHDPASDVTVAVATACIAIAVAYEAKSFGEKNSRNKYGIDKNGYKIGTNTDDDEGAVG